MAKVPYASIVGAMVCTRSNIVHTMEVVSRCMAHLGIKHWKNVKWLLRCLRGTSGMLLCFMKNCVTLEDFIDTYLDSDLENRKSTSSYVFTLGDTAVDWISRL